MNATTFRQLTPLTNCYLIIPGAGTMVPRILPDVGDSKSAQYNDEPVIGRSMPMKTYSHSENRAISVTWHFLAASQVTHDENLKYKKWIQSAVYPRNNVGDAPFVPPPVCQIKIGQQLADSALCVVLKSYSVKYPTDVPWDNNSYMPWKFDIDTSWDVVYKVVNLPGADRIVQSGL